MRALSLVLLATLPVTATAQGLAESYQRAHGIFGNLPIDLFERVEATEALLPDLEGDWALLGTMGNPGPAPGPEDEEEIAYEELCDVIVYELIRTSRLSFDLVQTALFDGRREQQRYRFEYAGFSAFLRSQSTADLLANRGIGEGDRVDPAILMRVARTAVVRIYHPSPDILVMIEPDGRTDYYGRCP